MTPTEATSARAPPGPRLPDSRRLRENPATAVKGAMRSVYSWLADGVLILHGLIVLFNIGALPLIWVGYLRKWSLVRNPYFRMGHLLLLGYVVAETACGVNCPLTVLEDSLRLKAGSGPAYQDGFIAHWLQPLIFWDLAPWMFVVLYLLFFAAVVFTFIRIPPRMRSRTMKYE